MLKFYICHVLGVTRSDRSESRALLDPPESSIRTGSYSELPSPFFAPVDYQTRCGVGTYQGNILMGWHESRFPPRAFTISGSQITPDQATVESFLGSGRYDEVFSFHMLPCAVQIREYSAGGTCTSDGTLNGWYQLAYEYTGTNAARCRETRGKLLDDTGIMIGRKPAFGGERVDFSGQIDPSGYGSVRISYPDGQTGNLDVIPF